MTIQRFSRSHIIVAVMVPFALLALIGLGLTAYQGYRLSFWGKSEATYVGSEPLIRVQGSSTDHTYWERHYRFSRKDGGEVQLHFVERESGAPTEKSMTVLYDPPVQGEISRSEGNPFDATHPNAPLAWRKQRSRAGLAAMVQQIAVSSGPAGRHPLAGRS